MIDSPRSRLWNFWFAPFPPATLGFCRLIFFALLSWFYSQMDYATWGDLPASMMNKQVFFFHLFHIPVAGHHALRVWQIVWKISLITASIGVLTRASVWTALISSAYLFGVPGNFGKMGHGEGILVITMIILALSRCGDAWSIDSLARTWQMRDPNKARLPQPSGEYRWPIRMVWLLMSMIFLGAGITKLRISGLEWVTTDNLSTTILQHFYGNYGEPISKLGVWIARHRLLCKIIAAFTIIIEISFPLVLFNRLARKLLVPAMFLAQVGIFVMMGIKFTQFMFGYVFFIPWDCIGRTIGKLAPKSRYAMLYDGGCGICRSVASMMTRLDLFHRVEFIDIVNDWQTVQSRWPTLDQSTCLTDIHAVMPDGAIVTRYLAYRRLAWAIPALWVLLPILYLPPVAWIGDRIYGYIAMHRHDAGCAT